MRMFRTPTPLDCYSLFLSQTDISGTCQCWNCVGPFLPEITELFIVKLTLLRPTKKFSLCPFEKPPVYLDDWQHQHHFPKGESSFLSIIISLLFRHSVLIEDLPRPIVMGKAPGSYSQYLLTKTSSHHSFENDCLKWNSPGLCYN